MDVLSAIFYLRAPPWHAARSLRHHYTHESTGGDGGHTLRSYEPEETTNSRRESFPNVLRNAHQLIPSISLDVLLRHPLHVIPTTCAISRRKIQSLVKTKSQTKELCSLHSPRIWSIKSDASQLCPAWLLKFSGLWTAGGNPFGIHGRVVSMKEPCFGVKHFWPKTAGRRLLRNVCTCLPKCTWSVVDFRNRHLLSTTTFYIQN
jgi:hypothetical protein